MRNSGQVCSTPTRNGAISGWWAAASGLRMITSRVDLGSMISSTHNLAAAYRGSLAGSGVLYAVNLQPAE